MASLVASFTTLKRAHKDFVNLKESIYVLQRGQHHSFVFLEQDRSDPHWFHYRFANPIDDICADIGVITGQFRAALDQLIYSLFELRNGHPPPAKRRTQFPIQQYPEDFKSRIRPDLGGLDTADIMLIENRQPYNGGHWLWHLKLLAEEHKHRRLVGVTGHHVTFAATAKDPTDSSSFYTFPLSQVHTPKAMNVDTTIAGPITFKDGTPIVEKLEIIQAQVTNVIDAFKSLFD